MALTEWHKGFLATTRGQVVAQLRLGPKTVDALAVAVGLTDNGVRAHLQALERDGLVQAAGTRRTAGVGKPARLYEMVPDAEERFSRAYALLFRALVDTLARRKSRAALAGVLEDAGRRLGREFVRPAHGRRQQAIAALGILSELGGVVELEEGRESDLIRGAGCPVSAATTAHPAVCRGVAALLAEAIGADVRECCARNGRPRCRFEIRPSGSPAH